MSTQRHTVLIIGCGSIGERHLRTFLATGRAQAIACDPNPAIRAKMTATYGVAAQENWETALADPTVTGAVVATPAPMHVKMAVHCLAAGRHVLIEKPLALEVAGTDELVAARTQAGRFAAVAYVQHLLPALQGAREFIRIGQFGPIRHATILSGQNFPTFRPAYREIYYNNHAQGGGAIQDALTHNANSVEWILGPTTRIFCDAAHQVLDGVTVEDTVNIVARNGGTMVNYSLNQFQAPNETRWDFHAEKGSVRAEMHTQRWGTLALGETDWTWRAAPVENRDTLFVAQANAFLDGCEGKPTPLCTIEEGIRTLRFNVAALKSARTGQQVEP